MLGVVVTGYPAPAGPPSHSSPAARGSHHAAHPDKNGQPLRDRSSAGGGRVNFAPHGAVYLTVRAVRASTLKREFGVGPQPRDDVIHDPEEVSPATAVMEVQHPESFQWAFKPKHPVDCPSGRLVAAPRSSMVFWEPSIFVSILGAILIRFLGFRRRF